MSDHSDELEPRIDTIHVSSAQIRIGDGDLSDLEECGEGHLLAIDGDCLTFSVNELDRDSVYGDRFCLGHKGKVLQ